MLFHNLEIRDSNDPPLEVYIKSRFPVNSKPVELLTFSPLFVPYCSLRRKVAMSITEIGELVPKEPSRLVLKEPTRSVPEESSRSVPEEPSRSVPKEPSRLVLKEPTRSVSKESSRSVLKESI
nr:hypothetical protein [Tanacetum cinerariifolium]